MSLNNDLPKDLPDPGEFASNVLMWKESRDNALDQESSGRIDARAPLRIRPTVYGELLKCSGVAGFLEVIHEILIQAVTRRHEQRSVHRSAVGTHMSAASEYSIVWSSICSGRTIGPNCATIPPISRCRNSGPIAASGCLGWSNSVGSARPNDLGGVRSLTLSGDSGVGTPPSSSGVGTLP
ncbi:hypothetical protein CALCODRAFT_382415 [Calocera cornea HHB12733]|uniref:Uncharacterized protein n=1 Tax=Calocera cornea HHB12733 TaxID=1353952 RepID=A0A165EBT9_9BASI|nr:hypothetical protein CALCODRAFT_382415 [Calocera cornea HHB12733]